MGAFGARVVAIAVGPMGSRAREGWLGPGLFSPGWGVKSGCACGVEIVIHDQFRIQAALGRTTLLEPSPGDTDDRFD